MSIASPGTSLQWHLAGEPAPKLFVPPPDATSLDEANAAIELWEHYKRRKLDPWQRLSVQLKMATNSQGRWAARTTGEEVPRQAGKGDAEEVVELWGLVQRAELILHTVHDAVLLATRTQERMLSLLDGHADLRRKKARQWVGTGQQMIEMRNGGTIWYRTRTGGGGRGVDEVDRIVVDEAQHAESGQIEATSPTQLASVNPQTNVMGTGALPGRSAWWWLIRKRALFPDPGEFSYLGFTAEELSVVDGRVVSVRPDVSTVETFMSHVAKVHPALQRRPELFDFFAEEYRKLGPEGAAREYLLVWDPEPDIDVPGVIDQAAWQLCHRQSSSIAVNRSIGYAVSPDQRWASIAVAGRRDDGMLHIEVVDRRPGTAWLVDRLVEAWLAFKLPVRAAKADKNALVGLLRERGVQVVEVPTSEVGQSVGLMRSAVESRTLIHLGQGPLDAAVKVAQVSGSGVWVGSSDVEVTPLDAVTLAVGGVPQAVDKPARRPVFVVT